jgi:hypothetical protein
MSGREEAIDDDAYSGADADDGIVTRSVRYLFHQVRARQRGRGWFPVTRGGIGWRGARRVCWVT